MPLDENPENLLTETPSAPGLDFTEYWQIIYARRWAILALTVVTALLASVYFSMLPDLYTASTQILIERQEFGQQAFQQQMAVASFRAENDYYGTQIAILTGRKTADWVQQELGGSLPVFSVQARRLKDTRIILLSAKCRQPQWSARVANKYAEVFVRESTRENLFVNRQVLSKLIPQDDEIINDNAAMEQLGRFNKKEFVETLSAVRSDPVVARMKNEKIELEGKISDLSKRYKPSHPVLKEALDRLDYVSSELKGRIQVILNNLRADLAGEVNITNIRVLEEALVPERPSEPNRPRSVLVWSLLGFVFSVGLVLFSENVNQRVRTEKDLLAIRNLPFLGYIPVAKEIEVDIEKKRGGSAGGQGVSLVDALKNNVTLSDAVASVRTHILFSMPYEKSRRIMLTSAIPNEGKTTAAILLSLSLTSLGRKILLIEGDMRLPFLHTYLNMSNEKGLSDFLVGSATAEEIIRAVPGSSLKIITGGTRSVNPSELLASDRFGELLDAASQSFDRIVVDVPPTLYIPDGLVVAKRVHSGILVCGSGMVHKRVVQTVIEKFNAIGHAFIGIVINRADYEKEGYRYKYYSMYKSYYTRAARSAHQAEAQKEGMG